MSKQFKCQARNLKLFLNKNNCYIKYPPTSHYLLHLVQIEKKIKKIMPCKCIQSTFLILTSILNISSDYDPNVDHQKIVL